MDEHVFALDIGTQSVTGLLLKQENETYRVIDFCIRQHKERTMLDGQIQNVVQVAEVIADVRKELEKKHGPLAKVCVAAAGRALKTIQAEKSIQIQDQPITTEEEVKHLELSAVQHALTKLTKENNEQFSHYHCVGYSVLHYKLDGENIGSFIDQIGNEATVEIIATFLPKVVVESLLAALERAQLTMEALTLEPIAAIHVLVPESMRRLNVALIDIGAGTSDIAISSQGTIVAYGMVPTAGDEITEAISDYFLLDFKVAEKTKQQIVNEKQATVQDILGFESLITYEELVPQIMDRINELAQLLANEVRILNGKSPQAVMLIGGGSLTPMINEKIAEYLQLPTNRVAVRGIEAIEYLEHNDELPTGPDFVTPVGIAISATQNPLHYTTVYVNEKITFLFEVKQLTIGDALIQAGIDINKYYGKIGLAAIVTVNGREVTLPGKYGEPPSIYVNGKLATVDTLINSDDKIAIYKGKDGENAYVSIKDLVGEPEVFTVFYNEKKHVLKPTYLVNGKKVTNDYILEDKDDLVIQNPKTIRDFLQTIESANEHHFHQFEITVNKQKLNIKEGELEVRLNNQLAKLSTTIKQNDHITIIQPKTVTVKTVLKQLNKKSNHVITVSFNGKPVELSQQLLEIKRDDTILTEESELQAGDILTVSEKAIRPFIFQDIFRFIDIDISQTKGSYNLYRNGERTSFHAEILHGDQLEIIWS